MASQLSQNSRGGPADSVADSLAPEQLEQTFRRLLDQWDRETLFTSSTTELFRHPACRAIVAMGKPAVPLLVAELRRRPGMWLHALREITGVSPLTGPGRHEFDKLVEAWLRWGSTWRAANQY